MQKIKNKKTLGWKIKVLYLLLSGILKSTCYIDVRWFPFDIQKCDLKFGSWTHNGWLLDLQMMDVDISTYIPNGEWDLVGKKSKKSNLIQFLYYTHLYIFLFWGRYFERKLNVLKNNLSIKLTGTLFAIFIPKRN